MQRTLLAVSSVDRFLVEFTFMRPERNSVPRSHIPRNVQRGLWSEAMGHCMNPACGRSLIQDDVNLGECAHIVPHANGGDTSFQNLILLCRTCHVTIDSGNNTTTTDMLRRWKSDRANEIEGRFVHRFPTFSQLSSAIVPLLKRNSQIFDSYGPYNDDPNDIERQNLWTRFEGEIACNNRRLVLLLEANKGLLHPENQEIVGKFSMHASEFISTRGDAQASRQHLFPRELLSVFGLNRNEDIGLPPSVAALQNFISHLIRKGSFISLRLDAKQTLTYKDNGARDPTVLNLNDRPRMQQVFWNGRFYRPKSTNLRLESLVFFTQWLRRNRIAYEIPDYGQITELLLNKKYRVKLCYEYCLSRSDLDDIALAQGLIVVNLHNWNDGPVSSEASAFADKVGVRLFNQNEFFVFAHRRIK